MTLPPVPAREQPVAFTGPAGAIEGVLDLPVGGEPAFLAVVCHPHPLHGGTMHNKVAHTLARALREQGGAALRFNFRGVGASVGVHDGGIGETGDALAAAAEMRERWPVLPLVLAGFSFGAGVALRAAATVQPDWLVCIAPAVDRVPLDGFVAPACPWLILQGDADEVVDPASVVRWAGEAPGAPQLVLLPGVGHFFHGQLHALREQLLAAWPPSLALLRRARSRTPSP
jgi:alpha/beta superfamily hydrolase